MKSVVLVVCCGLLLGCAARTPAIGFAQQQHPAAGSPAVAWLAREGRCRVQTPLSSISCHCIVRRLADGSVRLVLLADEGPLLLDVQASAGTVTVVQAIAALQDHAALLGAALWQVWGAHAEPDLRLDDDHWQATQAGCLRYYGGDPALLRTVAGAGPQIRVGDYQILGNGLLAHRLELQSTLATVALSLGTVELSPAR